VYCRERHSQRIDPEPGLEIHTLSLHKPTREASICMNSALRRSPVHWVRFPGRGPKLAPPNRATLHHQRSFPKYIPVCCHSPFQIQSPSLFSTCTMTRRSPRTRGASAEILTGRATKHGNVLTHNWSRVPLFGHYLLPSHVHFILLLQLSSLFWYNLRHCGSPQQ
jgi:hypothetical protein